MGSLNVSATFPELSRTSRQPTGALPEVPSGVGQLPTITHPVRNPVNAVVKPTPPGHGPGSFVASIWAKVVMEPSGAASMMVVPVRCNTRPYGKSYNCFMKTSRPLSS
jgi:hypothetical protein